MLCVIAKINESAKENLAALQQVATEQFGIPQRHLYGHITLATYVRDDEAAFIASCKTVLQRWSAFEVNYQSIEVLMPTPIIVAVPQKGGLLGMLQNRVVHGWENHLDTWTRPDVWLPHTTLVHAPQADLPAAAAAMQKQFQPFCAQITRIEFSRVTENGYEILDFCNLL